MATRSAEANWQGTLKEGRGHLKLESGVWEGKYNFRTRFEEEPGTNPEELIAAAHAGCFTMALGNMLGINNTPATNLQTKAIVHLGTGPAISKIELHLEGTVPGLTAEQFQQFAQQAKEGCIVSKALAGVPEITLDAKFV